MDESNFTPPPGFVLVPIGCSPAEAIRLSREPSNCAAADSICTRHDDSPVNVSGPAFDGGPPIQASAVAGPDFTSGKPRWMFQRPPAPDFGSMGRRVVEAVATPEFPAGEKRAARLGDGESVTAVGVEASTPYAEWDWDRCYRHLQSELPQIFRDYGRDFVYTPGNCFHAAWRWFTKRQTRRFRGIEWVDQTARDGITTLRGWSVLDELGNRGFFYSTEHHALVEMCLIVAGLEVPK